MFIDQQAFRTRNTYIFLDDEGILWIRPDENADVDEAEVESCFNIYKKMGIGIDMKVLQIVDAQKSLLMTREARDYAAQHGNDYFLASALLTNNPAVRIVGNFFALFYKNRKVPFKLFGDEESAKKWLAQFRE